MNPHQESSRRETQSEYGFREQREAEERKKWEKKAERCPAYRHYYSGIKRCNATDSQCEFKSCFGRYWR